MEIRHIFHIQHNYTIDLFLSLFSFGSSEGDPGINFKLRKKFFSFISEFVSASLAL